MEKVRPKFLKKPPKFVYLDVEVKYSIMKEQKNEKPGVIRMLYWHHIGKEGVHMGFKAKARKHTQDCFFSSLSPCHKNTLHDHVDHSSEITGPSCVLIVYSKAQFRLLPCLILALSVVVFHKVSHFMSCSRQGLLQLAPLTRCFWLHS